MVGGGGHAVVAPYDRALDQDRRVRTEAELEEIPGAELVELDETVIEGLFYILVEKTEGDAALRVNSGNPGEGLQAYMRVY